MRAFSNFKQPNAKLFKIVIARASEAIHRAAPRKNGLLRRFAPRNDVESNRTGLDRANQLDPVQQIARFINPLKLPVSARLCLGRFAATNYLNGYSSKLNFKKAPGI